MADQDPWATSQAAVSAGIKTGVGYDAALVNFKGTPQEVQGQIRDFFGMEATEQTPFETFFEADQISKGAYAAAGLGGKPEYGSGKTYPPKVTVEKNDAGDARGPDGKDALSPEEDLIARINACQDKGSIGRLYATNQAAWKGAVADAAKARAAAL